MTSCGDNYFAINEKKICGDWDFFSPDFNYANYEDVELVAAGEPLELHLSTAQTIEGKISMSFYTSVEKIDSSS